MRIKNKALFSAFFAGLLMLIQAPVSYALILVSDIDDTIKITNVLHPGDAVLRSLFSKQAFTGMSETYQSVGATVVYLSGSPTRLTQTLEDFLSVRNFPAGRLILKTKEDGTTLEYKVKKLEELFSSTNEQFLLIGDDTQADHLAYESISKRYPGRVVGTYIHQVRGINLPSGQVPFLTGYDLANALYENGRLNTSDLARTKQALLEERKSALIVPKFQICPKDYSTSDIDIQNFIRKICASR